MSFTVLIVSFLVHVFSFEYMENDPYFIKFLSYLSLFTFFMIVLISADNLIVLFVGWEGVGLCSYLLIGFWSTRLQAGKSSIKALLMNRIGDFFLLGAIALILKFFKTTDINIIFSLTPYIKDTILNFGYFGTFKVVDIISFLLLLAAIGKSAQIGLHTWLPDAMEGPTPVSALIHAATMVTAGVFLVIRFSYFIIFSKTTLYLLIIVGLFTVFFAGLTALGQWDLKKIIAFSTCSQLGYMFIACGLSSFSNSFYHLTTHAFFKALLFLTAGYIIHQLNGEQDIRKMGSLILLSPFSYILVLIASLSLIGMTALSGYYSKEAILHVLYLETENNNFFWIVYFLFFISIFLTILYSARMIYYVFFVENNIFFKNKIESDLNIFLKTPFTTASLTILLIFSIFYGYVVKNLFSAESEFFKYVVYKEKSGNFIFEEFISKEQDPFFFL